ncbi:hypothetical protein FISHEDRAFT_76856 [Fistulina hepatica ATCC 64428]|uniref:Uncharacterized protein n=1 Tax=Fistulina hepatica ATCC 64428 TaxID=1128425 RepID=A0A0D7A2B5_9AGAR|nr:hypothetical protein FISHEDRAFT_76856 [Fistulina hepatica ATCC 64428]
MSTRHLSQSIDKKSDRSQNESQRTSTLSIPGLKHEPALSAPVTLVTPHDTALAGILTRLKRDEETAAETGVPTDFTSSELYDPYDGSVLGRGEPVDPTEAHQRHEELWAHLSRVLALQTDIARMHTEMEGVGAKTDTSLKPHLLSAKRGRAMSSGTVDDDTVDEDEGVGMDDDEAAMNRAHEAEFAKLAGQFEGRKEAIDGIMSKLDELSKALTGFHALQAPNIDFSLPREDTPCSGPTLKIPLSADIRPRSSPLASSALSVDSPLPVDMSSSQSISAPKSLFVNTINPGHQTLLVDSPTSTDNSLRPNSQ